VGNLAHLSWGTLLLDEYICVDGVSEEVEQAILEHCLQHPKHGLFRVSQERMLRGWLYKSKLPIAAVDVLRYDAPSLIEAHHFSIHTILSDSEREPCGRPDKHPTELSSKSRILTAAPPRFGGSKD